jgi:hypothetical protein
MVASKGDPEVIKRRMLFDSRPSQG